MNNSKESKETMGVILNQIARTQEKELSCDAVYEVLDVYTEAVAHGEEAAALMPLVKQHLELCPDCQEEFEALLRVLEAKAES